MDIRADNYNSEEFDSPKVDVKTAEANAYQKNGNWLSNLNVDEDIVLEPVTPSPYDLAYACLMIPRFASHELVGDIVARLYEWLQQICISYGWRLELQNVQPNFLQWIIFVPPSIPPAYFMRVVRRITSEHIFEEFPRFGRENLSKDFWAPGYLAVQGNRPHSPDMITEFIKMTRRQQGLLKF
jgi:REP element-mobilizing transposase RayT